MPPINNLPAAVLAQILFEAAATPANELSEWKTKLPLLAVCRAWAKLVIGAVFDQVYVELSTSPHASPIWTSNADLFISRGCVLVARRLAIGLTEEATIDHLRIIVLDILKLDYVDWQCINTLTIAKVPRAYRRLVKRASQDEPAVADVAHVMQYFAQNLRNVVELNVAYANKNTTGKYLFDSLATSYGHQLQVLRAQSSTLLQISNIPRNIKVLELTLDSAAAYHLPSICGETLRVLKLVNVPRNFAWHHFRYGVCVQPIVFNRLTILSLWFEDRDRALTENDIQDKIALGAHSCDQLFFPALKKLSIRNCTPDCDLLYADFPFPELKEMRLIGSINSIRHCTRLKLSWVRDLHVSIYPYTSGETADIYRATNHFFSNICIGRTATLRIMTGSFVLDPDAVRWANLTVLDIRTAIYSTVCKAIGRLPNIGGLDLGYLEFGDISMDSFPEDSSLFVSTDPMLNWGENLKTLFIREFSQQHSLAVCVSCVQALILHAGVLSKLEVPESVQQPIAIFINTFKDCYPHLANITVKQYQFTS